MTKIVVFGAGKIADVFRSFAGDDPDLRAFHAGPGIPWASALCRSRKSKRTFRPLTTRTGRAFHAPFVVTLL
jgi:hypothetical protein